MKTSMGLAIALAGTLVLPALGRPQGGVTADRLAVEIEVIPVRQANLESRFRARYLITTSLRDLDTGKTVFNRKGLDALGNRGNP